MILEVDVGNTRIKWRLRLAGDVVSRGYGETSLLRSKDDLERLFANDDLSQLRGIYVATVVVRYQKMFVDWAANRFPAPVFAATSQSCAQIVNAYVDFRQMGVDRWLAIVAGYHRVKEACLIIDAGSAITIDVLRSNGRHLGGYIVPGLQLMRHTLFSQADQVDVPEFFFDDKDLSLSPGKSTRQAVASGLPLMILGMINSILSENKTQHLPFILVTGGDGDYLSALLRYHQLGSVEYIPELVLDGLAMVVEHKKSPSTIGVVSK